MTAAGNKNGALPILAACLLTSEPVVLHNMPRIRDVETMVALICAARAPTSSGPATNEVRVHAADVYRRTSSTSSSQVGSARRSCSRARCSRASAAPACRRPGGDVIGRRRLDPHIHALAELGAEIDIGARFELRTAGLRGKHIFLDEASVMATENTVMAAVADARARR